MGDKKDAKQWLQAKGVLSFEDRIADLEQQLGAAGEAGSAMGKAAMELQGKLDRCAELLANEATGWGGEKRRVTDLEQQLVGARTEEKRLVKEIEKGRRIMVEDVAAFKVCDEEIARLRGALENIRTMASPMGRGGGYAEIVQVARKALADDGRAGETRSEMLAWIEDAYGFIERMCVTGARKDYPDWGKEMLEKAKPWIVGRAGKPE